jgi:glycosyltransferase involved in cell wall biosynthesis
MKVGIDARLLTEPLSGISRYTVELTRELAKQGVNHYYLYLANFMRTEEWRNLTVSIRSANFRGRVSKFVWSQTLLPLWAHKDAVDLFWGPFRIPHYLSSHIARVITIHDLVWMFFGETMQPHRRWIERRLVPEAIRSADRIVAVSANTAEAVDAEFPESRGRVRVVYPGVTALPAPADRSSLTRFGIDRPYFLFVGTLEPRKNLPRLLRAYASLDAGLRRQMMLVIAGAGGWGKVDIHKLIAELHLTRDVLLTGFITDSELATLYAGACFLAMPSIYEGFGLPIVEAMSLGIPVLTSNSSSMPEVAGEAGLLVDPTDETSIAQGLHTLLSDESGLQSLAQHARSSAARFTWRNAAAQMSAIFAEAKADRRR